MILKLGLDTAQTDLQQKSFSLAPYIRNDNNRRATTANNSLHIDYTPVKKEFELNWEVISQSDFAELETIYNTQVSSLSDLVFTYEDSTGQKSATVYMPPPNAGNTTFTKGWAYNVSISLEEK